MRLDYYVAHAANLSRKDAKIAIAKKRVSLNGAEQLKANTNVAETDHVLLDGASLHFIKNRYYLFHKPKGVVCATEDAEHPIVLDLFPHDLKKELKIVGRLDKDTSGLLLLTTDGQWLHRVTSPRQNVPKTYLVDLAEKIDLDKIKQLEQGVQLKGEASLTKPASIVQHQDNRISLTISEGKYHQVKRMLAAVGNRVVALHRTRIGGITLPDSLAEGDWLSLTTEQIDLF